MLYKADFNKEFVIQRMFLRRMSLALHSSNVYLLPDQKSKKEIKYRCNYSVARKFKGIVGMTDFLHPLAVDVIIWRDQVIALDNIGSKHNNNKEERESLREYLEKAREHVQKTREPWYFDGTYLYSFVNEAKHKNIEDLLRESPATSSCGLFRSVAVDTININRLSYVYTQGIRQCLAFVASNGECAVSAPIWSATKTQLGGSDEEKDEDDREEGGEEGGLTDIAGQDKYHRVKLMFLLTAAKSIAKEFGYKSIIPLRLPQLMVQYKTVNLMDLAGPVLNTTSVDHVLPSMMYGWLLGLQKKSTTFEQMIAVRRLLKYLSARGMMPLGSDKLQTIMRGNQISLDKVPLIDPATFVVPTDYGVEDE